MNKRVWVTALGIGTVVALLGLPGGAIGKSDNFVIGATQTTVFRLKGSNGYSISVFGSGGTVSLNAKHGGSSATYFAQGLTSSTRIKARFGRLGRVSVRFHSDNGPMKVPLPKGNCRGGGEIVDSGIWVGRIEFKGEQAYTTAHATRAKGKVIKSLKQTCSKDQGENRFLDFRWTILSAWSDKRGIFSTAFRTTSEAHPAANGTAFSASLLEARGRGLLINRSINVNAAVDAFTSGEENGKITSATIAPPAPFKSTATFQRTQGSKGTWTGSLAGDFPGRGEVTLAGPEFSAEIDTYP